MRLKKWAAILFITTLSNQAFALTLEGRVVGVSDGDTVTVLQDREQFKVRLVGIDCPEKSQDFGQRAKQFTSGLVFGEDVKVEYESRDRYGRILGNVFLNGKSLSEELLKAGLAWHYRQFNKSPTLQVMENTARTQKAGLWSMPGPVPPWEFRKAKKAAELN